MISFCILKVEKNIFFYLPIFIHFFIYVLKQIKCLFKGDCIIDLRTRRFCPACRIKKCFEIGMKRDMILGKMACLCWISFDLWADDCKTADIGFLNLWFSCTEKQYNYAMLAVLMLFWRFACNAISVTQCFIKKMLSNC